MLVATLRGYVEIRDIRPGNMVLSRDEVTGAVGYKPVTAQYSNPYEETVYVRVRDGVSGVEQEIVSNRIHPFFVAVSGPRTLPRSSEGHDYKGEIDGGAWVDADDLEPGFKLLEDDGGWSEVVSVRVEGEPLEAYNLTVANWHTYFIAANFSPDLDAVWVHNACIDVEINGVTIRIDEAHAHKQGRFDFDLDEEGLPIYSGSKGT